MFFWKPLESLGESPASLGVAMGAEKRLQTAAWSVELSANFETFSPAKRP